MNLLKTTLKAGTRGSALALTQTNSVITALKRKFPKIKIEIVIIKTLGDKITSVPLPKGTTEKSFFTKEIEDALLDKRIDFAVHSLKDMASHLRDGLCIGAVLKRNDPEDCLVSLKRFSLHSIPSGAKIGTSSLRRQSQILAVRKDLTVENLRGNLDTRLRKLKEGLYDAIIVAQAGLNRLLSPMQRKGLYFYRIPYLVMLPAVGQGALSIECRSGDEKILSIIKVLDHLQSHQTADCERAFLRTLQGGCQVPAGALARIKDKKIFLHGMIASPDGRKIVRNHISGTITSAESLGSALANELLISGGSKILKQIR